jgi:hypothetical protein
MTKVLLVVAILGAGGYFAWSRIIKPEHRACAKMADLCGEKAKGAADCERDMDDMRKNMGDEPVKKFDTCIADAKSCPEAAGCLVGAGASGIGDMMNKFLKGVGNGLNK